MPMLIILAVFDQRQLHPGIVMVTRAMLAKVDWDCVKSAIQDLSLPVLEGMDDAVKQKAIGEMNEE